MIMIDNWKAVKDLLTFESDDDYYFLEVLQRRKDYPAELQPKVKDHMMLASWFITSKEKLDRVEEEAKALCRLKGARAYLNPSVKSKKRTTVLLMRECLSMMENDDFSKVESKLASAAGQCSGSKDRRMFLVDVDTKDSSTLELVLSLIEAVAPEAKHWTMPTVHGYHVVSTPFDVKKFNDLGGRLLKNVEIKHNCPALLYYNGD